MGLIARTIEAAGMATVTIFHTLEYAPMAPRAVRVRFPFGRAFGEPHNREKQHKVLLDALDCLVSATQPGTVRELPYLWRVD